MVKAKPTAENSGMKANSLHKYGSIIKKVSITDLKQEQCSLNGTKQHGMEALLSTSDIEHAHGMLPRDLNPIMSRRSQSLSSVSESGTDSESDCAIIDQQQVQDIEESGDSGIPIPVPIPIKVDMSIFDNSEKRQEHSFDEPTSPPDSVPNKVENVTEQVDSDGVAKIQIPRITNVESLFELGNPINVIDKNDNIIMFTSENMKEAPKRKASVDVYSQRKLKKRRSSATSSKTCCSNDSTSSQPRKKKDALPLSVLVEKKRWMEAIPIMMANLDQNPIIFPTPMEFVHFLQDCGLNARRKSVHSEDLLMKLALCIDKCGKDHKDSFEFIREAIGTVSSEIDKAEEYKNNCYWKFFDEIFSNLLHDAESKITVKKNLTFLTAFISLIEKSFYKHISKKVQSRLHMLVNIFEGDFDESEQIRISNLQRNLSRLADFLQKLQNYSEELGIMMRILNMVSHHYFLEERRRKHKEAFVTVFVSAFIKEGDYGVPVIQKLTQPSFGREFCLGLLEETFRSSGELESILNPEVKKKLLVQFAEYMSKTTLLSNNRHIEKNRLMKFGPLTAEAAELVKRSPPNGETVFHRICGGKRDDKYWKFDKVLEVIRFTKECNVNINMIDNAGNTLLHEAVFHGRTDCLEAIISNCCPPAEHRPRLLINPLHQRKDGETALHFAARKGRLDITHLVVRILGDKVEKNMYMKCKKGLTPLQCSKDPEVITYLNSLRSELSSWEAKCPIKFSDSSFQKIKEDFNLQEIISLLHYFESNKSVKILVPYC